MVPTFIFILTYRELYGNISVKVIPIKVKSITTTGTTTLFDLLVIFMLMILIIIPMLESPPVYKDRGE